MGPVKIAAPMNQSGMYARAHSPRAHGAPAQVRAAQDAERPRGLSALYAFAVRHQKPVWACTGAALALLAVFAYAVTRPVPPALAQRDIDAAVRRSLAKMPPESHAAIAYAAIKDSVVRVRELGDERDEDKDAERGVGTGVVVNEDGTILTNLHVVAGAHRIGVVFANGHESDAIVVTQKPEHDLAVIRAQSVPPKLKAATLRSTADLQPGDETFAVGFPFGIGPSVSAGVISGLHRAYRAPDGVRSLTNLIQFDATANPGNSGGPLLTMRGDVVGIVTAILSPGNVVGSVGIGFAVPIENAAAAVASSPF
jgi:S1-C subfamily serine protease